MKVFYVKQSNSYRYAGSCINFIKNNMKELFKTFPLKINELGLIIVKKEYVKLGISNSKLFSHYNR